MTESQESTSAKRGGGLSAMLLADLKKLAASQGIKGASTMKKAQLVEAIRSAQGTAKQSTPTQRSEQAQTHQPKADQPQTEQPKADQPKDDHPKDEPAKGAQQDRQRNRRKQSGKPDAESNQGQQQGSQAKKQDQQPKQGEQTRPETKKPDQNKPDQNKPEAQDSGKQSQPEQQHNDEPDEEGGSRRNRRRRGRERNRQGGSMRGEAEPQILDDDVLVPAAGILDVLENYAFVRTSGYLAGPEDVYLSLSMVKRYGLRRGDAIVGQVRQPREGERREKFNPMVRIDSVNGGDPDNAFQRPEFGSLTPLHPGDRLRMETDAANLTGRIIDLVAPIGKGQRGLIMSPANAGKTSLIRAIANAVTSNNSECHLMVVLVDERPEEVTDFERSVKGEVVASTFDRPPADHTSVAELAIERAKRLVELGHDVVVLLDGITRLARAYNLSAPAGGRVLSGGVDAAALFPPKRFFGAARNVENGGSLTILATASIESGSELDEVIMEEFASTANSEIVLSRALAEHRTFPAIDPVHSGTRNEDSLLSREELAALARLRAKLAARDPVPALEWLLDEVKKTRSNVELLTTQR